MRGRRFDAFPFLMVAPAAVVIAAVCVYPVVTGITMSFTDMSLMNPGAATFVGFDNFVQVAGDAEFRHALGFTLLYSAGTVVFSYLLGLGCALLMNRSIRLRSLVRGILLAPWVVPAVVGAYAWIWILNDQTGFINVALQKLPFVDGPILFLATPELARWTVTAFATWKAFPFMTIVLLASLQSIPEEVLEAARIDGAGWWKSLVHVVLPLIRKSSLLVILLQSMWMLNNFDNVFLLTKGGPALSTEVVSIYAYNTAFYRSSMGYASTISVIMMAIMTVLTFFYFRSTRQENVR